MSTTAVSLLNGSAIGQGWGEVERFHGIPYRWMVEPVAELHASAPHEWDSFAVICNFVTCVNYDVIVTVVPVGASEDRHATGSIRVGHRGRHQQVVTLDRTVPSGGIAIRLEALQPWWEPGSSRRLSMALTDLTIIHHLDETPLRRRPALIGRPRASE